MIIEFNGVPGSGKTTSLELLRHRISNAGGDVYDNQEIMKMMGQSVTPRLRLPVPDGSHRNASKLRVIFSLIDCILYSKKIHRYAACVFIGARLRSNFHFIGRLIETITIYDYFINNFNDDQFLIVDHGILQNIISFCHTRKLPQNSLIWRTMFSHLIDSRQKFIFVNCNASAAVALGRIRQRTVQHGRIAMLSDDLAETALRLQSCNLSVLRKISLDYLSVAMFTMDENQEFRFMQNAIDTLLMHIESEISMSYAI